MGSTPNPKLDLLAAFADVARALGNPHRLHLLEALAQGERSVDVLAGKTDLTMANASQHLQALRRAGFVEARRDGKHVIYRIASDRVLELVAALRRMAEEQLAFVKDLATSYFEQRDALEAVGFDDLMARLEDGGVTVIDVRPADEFEAGHLPRARNIPLAELAARLAELPASNTIVAYCRGPWCVLAFEAVGLLHSKGFDARRLDGGLPEWRLAGREVLTGAH